MSSSPFLYPNISRVPVQSSGEGVRQVDKNSQKQGEFESVLNDLNKVRVPLKFSAHASQRLKDRKIELGPAVLAQVNDAIDRAEAKGVEDGLILTSDAALIVNIKNRTIVTALDRTAMNGNVFTNIDGAVIL